jgi:hypothetical protein
MKQEFYAGMAYAGWALAAMLFFLALFVTAVGRVLSTRPRHWTQISSLPLREDLPAKTLNPKETP